MESIGGLLVHFVPGKPCLLLQSAKGSRDLTQSVGFSLSLVMISNNVSRGSTDQTHMHSDNRIGRRIHEENIHDSNDVHRSKCHSLLFYTVVLTVDLRIKYCIGNVIGYVLSRIAAKTC